MKELKCSIIITSGQAYSEVEGNAAAGVVEFKNDYYGQVIAEMIKTAGDLLLAVLADKKQISHC